MLQLDCGRRACKGRGDRESYFLGGYSFPGEEQHGHCQGPGGKETIWWVPLTWGGYAHLKIRVWTEHLWQEKPKVTFKGRESYKMCHSRIQDWTLKYLNWALNKYFQSESNDGQWNQTMQTLFIIVCILHGVSGGQIMGAASEFFSFENCHLSWSKTLNTAEQFFLFSFFGCVGSLLLHTVFLSLCSLWQVGATLRCSARASHCGGFSCCRARALGSWASVVAARGLSSCGAWA